MWKDSFWSLLREKEIPKMKGFACVTWKSLEERGRLFWSSSSSVWQQQGDQWGKRVFYLGIRNTGH